MISGNISLKPAEARARHLDAVYGACGEKENLIKGAS
jgi:hypothetical protein